MGFINNYENMKWIKTNKTLLIRCFFFIYLLLPIIDFDFYNLDLFKNDIISYFFILSWFPYFVMSWFVVPIPIKIIIYAIVYFGILLITKKSKLR